MNRLYAAVVFCLLSLFDQSAEAASPACGETYTVASGDTLSEIAEAAYQDPNLWPYVYGFSSNASVVGEDP
ncbi:MAG: peptidoglycan-binding protein, partial [Pseudomonadota bacterium]